jgi:hypothetical protein
MCGKFNEDGGHMLLKCKEVRKVWRKLNLEDKRCRVIGAGSAREMIEMMFTMTGKKQLTALVMVE